LPVVDERAAEDVLTDPLHDEAFGFRGPRQSGDRTLEDVQRLIGERSRGLERATDQILRGGELNRADRVRRKRSCVARPDGWEGDDDVRYRERDGDVPVDRSPPQLARTDSPRAPPGALRSALSTPSHPRESSDHARMP
jgi:hypothetical protein